MSYAITQSRQDLGETITFLMYTFLADWDIPPPTTLAADDTTTAPQELNQPGGGEGDPMKDGTLIPYWPAPILLKHYVPPPEGEPSDFTGSVNDLSQGVGYWFPGMGSPMRFYFVLVDQNNTSDPKYAIYTQLKGRTMWLYVRGTEIRHYPQSIGIGLALVTVNLDTTYTSSTPPSSYLYHFQVYSHSDGTKSLKHSLGWIVRYGLHSVRATHFLRIASAAYPDPSTLPEEARFTFNEDLGTGAVMPANRQSSSPASVTPNYYLIRLPATGTYLTVDRTSTGGFNCSTLNPANIDNQLFQFTNLESKTNNPPNAQNVFSLSAKPTSTGVITYVCLGNNTPGNEGVQQKSSVQYGGRFRVVMQEGAFMGELSIVADNNFCLGAGASASPAPVYNVQYPFPLLVRLLSFQIVPYVAGYGATGLPPYSNNNVPLMEETAGVDIEGTEASDFKTQSGATVRSTATARSRFNTLKGYYVYILTAMLLCALIFLFVNFNT